MGKFLIILCGVFLSFGVLTNNYAQESTQYLCIIDDSGNKVQVAQFTTTVLPSGDVHAEFITSLAVNDNSYGLKDGPDNSVGWGDKTHKFTDLLGSDKAIFEIYDESGSLTMDFDLDYLGIDPNALSGYASHGIDENGEKSDGELRTGQASWLLDYNTSLTRNLNDLGYSTYTELSPETINGDSYTVVDPADASWIFEMIYEVTISKDAFGPNGFAGQSKVVVPDLHNSPSKMKIEDPFDCEPPVCDGLIGDFIWEDQDCDGIQDPGEPGISGITVYLKDSGGNTIGVTTTDINGEYVFEVDDLCEPDPTDCEECEKDNKDNTGKVSELTLKYNGSVTNANIVVEHKNGKELFNGTVNPGSSFSFLLADNTGKLDNEIEIFVDGHSEQKIHTSCSQPIAVGMEFGDFEIVAGATEHGGPICSIDGGTNEKCYTVEVDTTTLPAGYYPSPIGAGPSDKDSNPNPSSVCLSSENYEDYTIDFGFCKDEPCLNTIGDFVWHDTNTNGIQDENETGIEGVVVDLLDAVGSPLSSTITNFNGYYEFPDLPDGSYKVRVPLSNFGSGKPLDSTAPNVEWNASPVNKGGDDSKDSDAPKGGEVTVVLDCNDDLTIDFGFFKSCVTVDKTGPTQAVSPGDVVNYTLTVTNCGDATLSGGVDIVDVLLGYSNNVVLEPDEVFSVTIPYTVTEQYCEAGTLTNCVEVTGHPIDIYGTGYPNVTDEDCWTVQVHCETECEGEIGDRVWKDLDCDGVQDDGEPGLVGVTVHLLDPDDNNSIIATTVTGADGIYKFTQLCDDCYVVEVQDADLLSAGYTASTPNPQTVCLNETNGRINYTIDFGYCPPECEGEIGDRVWKDLDCDGVQDDGEPGLVGVTIHLLDPDDNNSIIATTVTGADGIYKFTQLCDDCYVVEVQDADLLSAGYTASTTNPQTVCLNETNGRINYTIDFGYCPPDCDGDGQIGDRVWLDFEDGQDDTNCDGLQQQGEPGIEGVKVILKDATGAIIAMDTTDVNGNYLFDELCTDDICYTVIVDPSTLPPGYVPTPSNVGSDDTIDSDGSGVEVCLTDAHKVDLTIDFGYCPTDCPGCEYGCIGDFVWKDLNENGIQDDGEPGMEGITVELYSEGGIKAGTTVTDSDGYYLFTDIIPGSYYVKFILPAGYIFTLKDQGTDDEADSDAGANGRTALTLLYPGVCDISWDAGLIPAPAAPSCIGDRVWFDSNLNGIQDLGESGIVGVTVNLWSGVTLIGTEITDSFGEYKFTNIAADNYYLEFILPTGYTFTQQNEGSDPELDSDANPDNGKTIQFYLGDGDCQLHWDAGMYANLPDLRLDKVVDNPNPETGDIITFTITVCNDGPADATGVEVTDSVLTEGVTYQSYTSSQGTYTTATGVWVVGALASGSCATLELKYIVEEWDGEIEYDDFDLGVAGDYNVFAICSVNFPSSDTECRMAVGWDAYLSNYSVGDKLPPSGGTVDALVVGRSLTFTSGAVYGGNVVYGTTTNLPDISVGILDGSLIQDPNRIDFTAAGMYLKNLSSNLAGYPVNGNTNMLWGGLTLTGTDPHLNVFNVSGEDLTSTHTLTINAPNGSVVLVNIDGDNISWGGGLFVNGTSRNNVLYNFYEATKLTIQGIQVEGSVLAACAFVDFVSGQLNGQLIARYITGRGQVNCDLFVGHIPDRPHIVNVAEITHVDQGDPDSTPGNGVAAEDDYAAATVFFEGSNGNSGGNTGNDGWEPVGSLSIEETVWTISADYNGNLLAGTAGGRLYISYNSGVSWTHINSSMFVGFIWSIAVTDNGGILIGTEQGMFFSSDQGATWIGPLGELAFDIRAVAIDNSTNTWYAAGWGLGVYKSVDFGATWAPVNAGLGSFIVNSLVIDSQGRLFAGTFDNGVYVSVNGGVAWSTTNLSFSFVWAMAATSTDHIYAATYGGGVFCSIDNGISWQEVNTGLGAQYVYAIAVNATDNVYVSTWTGGIFKYGTTMPKSQSNGNTVTSGMWEPVGLTGTNIGALMVDRRASEVYAGGENGTIYKRKENIITDTEITEPLPEEFSLAQNFPNPFNPSTTIKFSIPEQGYYNLRIYNIVGEQVAHLVNGEMEPGHHDVFFDASNLSSGVYLYSLVGKNVNITKKMILMK